MKSKKRGDYSSHQKVMTGVKRKLFGGFFVFGTMAIFEIASAIMLVNSVGSQDQVLNNEVKNIKKTTERRKNGFQ
ncbi:unnamed protein product [Caenorhabditis nigoni]